MQSEELLTVHSNLNSQFETLQVNWEVFVSETLTNLFDTCQAIFELDPTIKKIGVGLEGEVDEEGEETGSDVVLVWGSRVDEDTAEDLTAEEPETEAEEELHTLQCLLEDFYTWLVTEETLIITRETTLEELEELILM